MRWTAYYTMMSLVLLATLGLMVYASAENKPKRGYFQNDGRPQGLVAYSRATGHTQMPQQAAPMLSVGATREEVMETLGAPAIVSDGNDCWTYGTHALIFKDDRVAGTVVVDREYASRMLESKLEKLETSANTSRKTPTRKPVISRSVSKSHRRNVSTRPTSWEPMYRRFYSDQPVPRGMRTTTGNRAMPQYRNQRYHNPNAIYNRN